MKVRLIGFLVALGIVSYTITSLKTLDSISKIQSSRHSSPKIETIPESIHEDTINFKSSDLSEAVTERKKDKILVFIAIISCTQQSNDAKRKAVREGWVNLISEVNSKLDRHQQVEYKFFVGDPPDKDATQSEENSPNRAAVLQRESELFNDLVILDGVNDGYKSLSRKMMAVHRWVRERYDNSFTFKLDDDSWLRVDRLHSLLLGIKPEKAYIGQIYWRSWVNENPQARMFEEEHKSLSGFYPPYACGGGYGLSMDLIDYLLRNEQYLRFYSNEDAGLGVWLSGLEHKRYVEQKILGCGHPCAEGMILAHWKDPNAQADLWNRYLKGMPDCDPKPEEKKAPATWQEVVESLRAQGRGQKSDQSGPPPPEIKKNFDHGPFVQPENVQGEARLNKRPPERTIVARNSEPSRPKMNYPLPQNIFRPKDGPQNRADAGTASSNDQQHAVQRRL